MKRFLTMLLLAAVTATGCYYDVEEELYPPGSGNCNNPATISFAQHITPLLQSNGCVGCHSGTSPSGNVNLSTFNGVKAKVNDGRLWGAINHLPGFSPMPQGGNKINACDIAKIKSWIDAGAPNN